MKLTFRLLTLLGYVVHIGASVLQFEEILVHPGIIGGIFRGPNSETIIQGPDGSAIAAEHIGGAVETPDVFSSAATAESDINSIPLSSTARPELLIASTVSPISIANTKISSTASPFDSPLVITARPLPISNKPVPISSSVVEISTLSRIPSTTGSEIQSSPQTSILSSEGERGSLSYEPGFITASEPAKVLLPPSSPPVPVSATPVNVYQGPLLSSNQAIHLRLAPINSIVSTTEQPVWISPQGNLELSRGYANNALGAPTPTGSNIPPQNELKLLSVQQNGISTIPVIQPESSIGVLQQPVTSTLSPVSLVHNTEIVQKSNIQKIASSRPSAPIPTVDANPYLTSSGNTVSVPRTAHGPQPTLSPGLENVQTPQNIPLSTRQNNFDTSNRYKLISSEAPIVSSTVAPLYKSNFISNEPDINQILLPPQQNGVGSNLPDQAILISSGVGDTRQLNTENAPIFLSSTNIPDTAVSLKVEPLDNQVLSNPDNVPTRNIFPLEITVTRAPEVILSTAIPNIGSKEQNLALSQLPNNQGVGQNRPQQNFFPQLPAGANERGATLSSQTTVTDALGDVAPNTVGQKVPIQTQYEVYQSYAENRGLLSDTNPFVSFPSQNSPGTIPTDARPLTFDTLPPSAGVSLPPKNFDDSSASILWNRYERSSERSI